MKPKFNTARFSNKTIGATLVTAIVVCLSGTASATTWEGDTSGDWNTATNWSGDAGTGGTNAVINLVGSDGAAPYTATITAAFGPLPIDIFVGDSGNTGLLNHRDGAAVYAGWMFVGRAGGTGTYNLADTTTPGAGISGFAPGTGSMSSTGRFYVGGFDTGGGFGTVNMNTSGTFAIGSEFHVGHGGGTGIFNLESGAVTSGNPAIFGGGSGSIGTVNMPGGSLTVAGEIWVGNAGGGNGTLNLSAGAVSNSSWVAVGRGGASGTVAMTGGSWTKTGDGDFLVGTGGGSVGLMTQSAGSVTSNNTVRIGDGGGSTGTLTLSGGSFIGSNQFWVGEGGNGTLNISDSGSLTSNSWVAIGRSGGTGTVNMSGGSWTKNNGDSNFIIGANGPGTMNLSGGFVTVGTAPAADRGITWIGEANTGTLNISGTGDFLTEHIGLAVNGGTTGNLNLNGGFLTTAHIVGGGGTANVSFNGTQIIAYGASTSFISNLDSAVIGTGGMLVETNYNLTADQALTGTGGIVKDGGGTLTLTGANAYTGAVAVNAGGFATTTASVTPGDITLADYTTLGLAQTTADQVFTSANVTFGSSDETTLNLNLGNHAGITASAPLNVTGTMTVNGPVTVNIADSQVEVGVVPLISYASESLSGSFVLGTLPDGVIADPIVDDNAGLVSLNITRANVPHWEGGTVGLENIWDVASTANWINGYDATATTFENADPVVFDDDASVFDVVLNTTASPGGSGVTFDNTTAYTLTGTGSISGSTGLTKSNTGLATISTSNDYTGVTTLSGGTLSAGTLSNGGFASPIGAATSDEANLIFNGGTLYYTGATTTIDRSFITTGTGGGIGTDNDLTISGSAYSEVGNFTKTGAGNLAFTFDGTNVFGGGSTPGIAVLNGTLTFDGTAATQFNDVTGELRVGSSPGVSAHAVFTDTTVTTTSYLTIGRGNGDGATSTLTATGSTISSEGFTSGFGAGVPGNDSDQTISLLTTTDWTNNGEMHVGESDFSNSLMTLSGSSQVTNNSTLTLARDGANSAGTLTLTGNSNFTKSDVGYISIGVNGTGTLNLQGNSTFTSNGGDFNVSDVGTSKGYLNIQDTATLTETGILFIGKGATTEGYLNMQGGTLNGGTTTIAGANGSKAVITQSAGIVNIGNDDRVWFGNNGQATWNQSGGDTTCSGYLAIGRLSTSIAEWNVTGGTLTQNPPAGDGYPGVILAEEGTGTITVSGTGVVDSTGGQINMATNAGTGTLNVNAGGTVRANQIVEFNVGTSAVNFDGGTLVANAAANINFVTGIDTTTVNAGGVTVDSNGQTIGIDVDMLEGSGGGALTKTGTGTLYLNGANTYTGTTTVSAGALGGTGSIAGPLVVDASAAIAPGANAVGTFAAGATIISGSYACEIDGTSADQLVANGTLDVSAASLDITELNPASGSFVIATYTGAAPAPFASVTGLPAGYSVTYTGGQITLVSSSEYDSWASGQSLTGANNGPTQDPEFDGIENALEFVLSGDPLVSDTSILPDLDASGANFVFSFTRADESEAEIGLIFQYGSDLAGWTDVIIGVDNAGSGAGVDIVENTTAPDSITVTVAKGANTKLFGRLKAVK